MTIKDKLKTLNLRFNLPICNEKLFQIISNLSVLEMCSPDKYRKIRRLFLDQYEKPNENSRILLINLLYQIVKNHKDEVKENPNLSNSIEIIESTDKIEL